MLDIYFGRNFVTNPTNFITLTPSLEVSLLGWLLVVSIRRGAGNENHNQR